MLLPATASAQEKKQAEPVDQLQKLLEQIEGLPADAWETRLKALQARIATHRKKAAGLRKQAKALKGKAAAEERNAVSVEKEIERMQSLMALLRRETGPAAEKKATAAKKAPAQPAAKKKEVAKKSAPKSSAATKTAAKKAPPKKAAPKTAPPKTAATKTPASKTASERAPPPKKAEAKKSAPAKQPPPRPEPPKKTVPLVTFADHVLPILEENCVVCHDEDEASGGLIATSHASLLEGGSSGKTIVPRNPDGSRLYTLVAHLEKPYMPKDSGKLPSEQIALIRQWIELGAPADLEAAKAAAVALQAERAAAEKAEETADSELQGPIPMPVALPEVALAEFSRAPAVKTLATSPRAPLIAVSGHGQVLLYHAEKRACLAVLPFEAGQVEVLRFTADGTRLLVAGGRPGVRGEAVLYDVESGESLVTVRGERDTVLAAAVHPDGSKIAVGGASKRARVFATESGELLYEIRTHNDWILSIDFSPGGERLATADRAGVLSIWETDDGSNEHTIRPGGGAVHAARFRPDGRALAVACEDGNVRTYQLKDGKQLWRVAHGGAALALAWSPKSTLATVGERGRVLVWNKNGKQLGKSPALGDYLYSTGFGYRGEHLFAGDWAGRLHCLDAIGKKVEATLVAAAPGPRS